VDATFDVPVTEVMHVSSRSSSPVETLAKADDTEVLPLAEYVSFNPMQI